MTIKTQKGFSSIAIVISVILVLTLILLVTFGIQYYLEQDIATASVGMKDKLADYNVSKLEAEINQIRSETAGSLFMLKLIALFVTVGGAIGGYLIGQSRSTMAKINFEDRKNVDEVYQSIVKELADSSPILRATATVKLGTILKSFPAEWSVSEMRKSQIIELTKQVLAAALSIESDEKVLKTLSISVVSHKSENGLANVTELDFSGANAHDAYWAKCDFSYGDFYAANISRASFRRSDLSGVQFREANLQNAVLDESVCKGTNFKLADLRGASLQNIKLTEVSFEEAKVFGVSLAGSEFIDIKDCMVDLSEAGDGTKMTSLKEWLSQ